MADEESRLEAILEIIPNPPGQADPLPYHLELTDTSLDSTLEADFNLDLPELEALLDEDTPESYGAYLFRQVFEESVDEDGKKGRIGARLRQLLQRVEDGECEELVLKLEIARKLGALRSLAWEATLNPAEEHALAADRRMAFYRDVNVDAAQRPPIQGTPNVLIAVVSPDEAQMARLNQRLRQKGEIQEDLEVLDVKEEEKRLEVLFNTLTPGSSRQAITYHLLKPEAGKSTCQQLGEALEDGEFHVLHLSCHGLISKEDHSVRLVLLNEEGRPALVSELEFARIFRSNMKVRLVLLNACHSAETSQASGFSGIVPRLLPRVPAVIGMQRQWYTGVPDIKFCRMFYTELSKHGYVDRALQRARQRLFEHKPQKWVWSTPVLYLHLVKGRLFEPEKRSSTSKPTPSKPVTHKPTLHPEYYGGLVGLPGKPKAGGTYRGFPGKHTIKGHGPLEYAGLPPGDDIEDLLHGIGAEEEEGEEEAAPVNIYKQGVLVQAQEKFSKTKQRRALQELLGYYEQQHRELITQRDQPGANQERLDEEIEELEESVQALNQEFTNI